jgi:hypothetical protein
VGIVSCTGAVAVCTTSIWATATTNAAAIKASFSKMLLLLLLLLLLVMVMVCYNSLYAALCLLCKEE